MSRDNHILKTKLDQMNQYQEIKMKSETRIKLGKNIKKQNLYINFI